MQQMKWSQWHGLGKVGWSRDGTGLGGNYNNTQLSRMTNLIWRLHLRSQWNHRIGWLYCSWQWRLRRATSDDPETTPEEEKWNLSTHLDQGEVSVQQITGLASEVPTLSLGGDRRLHIFNKSLCVTTWNTSGPKHLWTQSPASTASLLMRCYYIQII